MRAQVISSASTQLLESENLHVSILPLAEQFSNLSVEEAYEIQLRRIQQKVNTGDAIVGKKIGLTSLAMQKLLGVDQPDYGFLLESMKVSSTHPISLSTLYQPKVEGEIAFVLKENLVGPNITADDVIKATKYVSPALEIVDSRIKDWRIKLEDTIADNASCGLFVLSEDKIPVENIDLSKVKMQLFKNGFLINSGTGKDVLENPANCVAWLANKLNEYNISLKAGEVILSGALSAAISVEPEDEFTAKFSDLGEVNIKFKP